MPTLKNNRIAGRWLAWEDMNWPSQDNLDKIKARADKLAAADVNAAMIFGTHFRWDRIPFFTLLHDYLGTVAEDYDTDIDHELDEMRFHRSRVNCITKVEPIGVSRTVRVKTDKTGFVIRLPEHCSYALVRVVI